MNKIRFNVSWNSAIVRIRQYLGWVICPYCNEGYDPTYVHKCSL